MLIVGLIALLWASLLLAVSYFVMLTLHKAEASVKVYGKIVAAVLLVAALVIAATGISSLVTGKCPFMSDMKKCHMMGGMQGGMQGKCGIMKGGVQAPAQQKDTLPIKCQ